MKKSASAFRALGLCGILFAGLLASCALGLQRKHLQTCKCGTPDYDVFGCAAECSLGETTCDNPLCTCEHAGEVPKTPTRERS